MGKSGLCVLGTSLFLLAACSDDEVRPPPAVVIDAGPDAPPGAVDCEVAIIGGGVGGLHTAFRLGPTLGAKVCLFEKEAYLGGRIKDLALDATMPNAPGATPLIGTGARRVMEGQDVLLDLADELDLTLQTPAVPGDLINARGGFALGKDALAPRYAGLSLDPDGNDHESYLYDRLRFGPERANIGSYPDFRSYVRSAAGPEEYDFLRDMSRFRADFEYPLDARGYLDYLDEEWDVCCTPSYPVGGMSAFIRGMEAKAVADGVRIYKSEPVSRIAREGNDYRVVSAGRSITAAKIVIAVPPVAFPHLSGDIVDEIAAKPQFKDLIGVKVATITQWWPTNWWATIAQTGAPANTIWRGWTTEHCINFIEIPTDPYGVAQKVTRSVYDDDAACVAFWEETAARGTAAVEAEIKRGLQRLFNGNGVTSPAMVNIPNPLKTHVEIWPAGWYWLRAGSSFTNGNIFDWAIEPLAGEDVALVGEAYHPRRSGWSDAAYKSSINLLNEKYGMTLPGLARRPDGQALRSRRGRGGRSLGGH